MEFMKKYFIYPADMALLSSPFWSGIDHVFKIASFIMGVIVFIIAIKRWAIDKKIKEEQLKKLREGKDDGFIPEDKEGI